MRPALRSRARALALCVAVVFGAGALPARPRAQDPAPAPAGGADEDEMHAFAIPETRAAKARLAAAEEHLAAARWSEAIDELQKLIEEHRGEMLGAERKLRGRARPSQEPVHVGASARARELLFALPAEARELYRARWAAPARAALAMARAQRDRRALAEVGRRWPIAPEAELAWWSLGDLEFEEGRSREARLAWGKALGVRLLRPELEPASADEWNALAAELVAQQAGPAAARARAAAALAADTRADAGLAAQEAQGSLRPGLAGAASVSPPGRSASAWAQPWRLNDPLPGVTRPRFDSFFAARAGELVFLNTPLHVTALNAWTGALVWESEEPSGWSALRRDERTRLFRGIDEEALMYAPAADAHVVVGVLQLPFSLSEEQYYSNMQITRELPEKRLYAFEAASGRMLWNHRPPEGWDGGPAPFEQRMTVAGPPVIRGERVLVPQYRLEGRIDYHVGCFDVHTGELLWSRQVVSGQRELNMFGRPAHEFCAPPLVVEGSRVIALTQLGTVACLDLFTGDVLWQSRYQQIPIPRNMGMDASRLQNVWRPALPVVTGRTVVATPFDSRDMLGIDLATGALVWSLPNTWFVGQGAARYASQELLFVGAGERSVYVLGQMLLGTSARAGLDRDAPTVVTLQYQHPDLARSLGALGRPVLDGNRAIVPLLDERVDVDLATGRAAAPMPWASGLTGGNLLVGPGELFSVSSSGIEGYFEWDAMVARARAEHQRVPRDARAVELLCQLLSTAAENSLADGKSESARASIEEARAVLDEWARSGPLPLALGVQLHRALRLEARVRHALADGDAARAALHRAREYAPTPEELLNTLLEELAWTDARSPARAEILGELEARVSALPLQCVQPLLDESRDLDPLSWVPLIGSRSQAEAEAQRLEIPVGLWVWLDRAVAARRARAPAQELAALAEILAGYAAEELPKGRAGELARVRIVELYASSAAASFESYEAAAQRAFESARGSSDGQALARIPQLFPCTRAAQSASDARIALALAGGQAGELCSILVSAIPADGGLARGNARQLELGAAAALAFEAAGNHELADELLRTLAEIAPQFRPRSARAGGHTLAELGLDRARWSAPGSAAPIGRFQPDPPRLWQRAGSLHLVGQSVPEDAALERLVLVGGLSSGETVARLEAWSSANLEEPAWSVELPLFERIKRMDASMWRAHCALARGRVLVAGPRGVLALDERTGRPAWAWQLDSDELECSAISASAGVVLVLLTPGDGGNEVLQALDAHDGTPLWREATPGTGWRPLPLVSSNALCFLPATGLCEVRVHELFSGAALGSFKLDQPAPMTLSEDAWIEGDRLLMPWIDHATTSQIDCWDLRQRRRSWRVDLDTAGEEHKRLSGLLQYGARTWLYVTSSPTRNPQLFELSSGIGALAPLSGVRLAPKDRLLGLAARKRRQLCTPELFVLSERPQAPLETRVRCIDLSSGERWSTALHAPFAEIANTSTPLPALSEGCVALAYSPAARSNRTSNASANVIFLDRSSGLVRADKRSLGQEAFGASSLEFLPLGEGLLVRGERRLELWK